MDRWHTLKSRVTGAFVPYVLPIYAAAFHLREDAAGNILVLMAYKTPKDEVGNDVLARAQSEFPTIAWERAPGAESMNYSGGCSSPYGSYEIPYDGKNYVIDRTKMLSLTPAFSSPPVETPTPAPLAAVDRLKELVASWALDAPKQEDKAA